MESDEHSESSDSDDIIDDEMSGVEACGQSLDDADLIDVDVVKLSSKTGMEPMVKAEENPMVTPSPKKS